MRVPQPAVVQRLVGPLLFPGQLLAVWLLGRHEDRHLRKRQGQEAQILSQSAPRKHGRRRRVRHELLMVAAAIRVAQEEDEKQRVDQQDNFDSVVVLFLAALTRAGLVNEGAVGLNLTLPVLPDGMEDLVEQVVPVLQRRGLCRTAYDSATLRRQLGLERPEGLSKIPHSNGFSGKMSSH